MGSMTDSSPKAEMSLAEIPDLSKGVALESCGAYAPLIGY